MRPPARACRSVACILVFAIVLAGKDMRAESRSFFSDELQNALPTEIRAFVDRYFNEIIESKESSDYLRRKLEFDEVKTSFPISAASRIMLAKGNGISLNFVNGKSYNLVWYADDREIGTLSFPASYDLICNTNQIESYRRLVDRLSSMTHVAHKSKETYEPGWISSDSCMVVRHDGLEFYLGHLVAHRYIDAKSGKAIWHKDFFAESLANLFCAEDMPDIDVNVDVLSYDMSKSTIRTSMRSLIYVLGESSKCHPYFGIESTDEEKNELNSVVVFHNPEMAYIHKLEVCAYPESLFPGEDCVNTSPLQITLQPYIKLHNLKNLWGVKEKL